MKVIVGKQLLTGANVAGLVEQEIRAGLNDRLMNGTAALTRPALNALIERTEVVAEQEAMKIFGTAADIIDKSKAGPYRMIIKHPGFLGNNAWDQQRERHGFDQGDLGGPTQIFTHHGISPTGGMNWIDLSSRWVRMKMYRNPQNARRFFKNNSTLVGNFRSRPNQAAWVSRFGGIKIKSHHDTSKLRQFRKTTIEKRWVLGGLEIQIFPNISQALLPMLSSHRWTDHNDGAFENMLFSGKTRDKLVGPPGRHRPLLQPITQFWMAFRIPAAIKRSIRAEFKK
jgi:hypothetical protein